MKQLDYRNTVVKLFDYLTKEESIGLSKVVASFKVPKGSKPSKIFEELNDKYLCWKYASEDAYCIYFTWTTSWGTFESFKKEWKSNRAKALENDLRKTKFFKNLGILHDDMLDAASFICDGKINKVPWDIESSNPCSEIILAEPKECSLGKEKEMKLEMTNSIKVVWNQNEYNFTLPITEDQVDKANRLMTSLFVAITDLEKRFEEQQAAAEAANMQVPQSLIDSHNNKIDMIKDVIQEIDNNIDVE